MAISEANMENRDIPIEICEDENSASKILDDKINARMRVIDAVDNAKKSETIKCDDFDYGKMNIWGNENMSFFLLKNDMMKDLDIFNTKDSQVIRMKDDDEMFEVSLDTSKYRPDELIITVGDGVISVEGKHEEQSDDGRKMVSRQFSRKYSLPVGAKGDDVLSNLSSDGVLVITVNKKDIRGESVSMSNTESKTCDVATNVQASELMKNERIPTNLRSNFFTDPFFKTNWDKHENVHHKIKGIFSPAIKDKTEKTSNAVMTNEAKPKEGNESKMDKKFGKIKEKTTSAALTSEAKQEEGNKEKITTTKMDKKFGNYRPRRWMLPALSLSSAFDTLGSINSDIVSHKEDQNVFEWKIDTSEYEPEEVKVTVSPDCILVEGTHEETSTEGKQILSRNFTKKYSLPSGIKQDDVVSKFTPDCGLTITAKRNLQNQNHKDANNQGIKTEHSITDGQNVNLKEYTSEDKEMKNEKKTNGGVKEAKSKLLENNKIHRNVKIEQAKETDMKIMSEHFTDKSKMNATNDEEDFKKPVGVVCGVKVLLSNSSDNAKNRNVKIEQETKTVSDNATEQSMSTLINQEEENKNPVRGAAGVRMHLMSSNKEQNDGSRDIKIVKKEETEKSSNDDKENIKSLKGAGGVKKHLMNSDLTSETKESKCKNYELIEPEKEKENLDEEYKKANTGSDGVEINIINSGVSENKNENGDNRNIKIEQNTDDDLEIYITGVSNGDDDVVDSSCGLRKINIERDTATKEMDIKISENEKKENQLTKQERNESIVDKIQNEKASQNRMKKENLNKDDESTGFEFRNVKIEHEIVRETESDIILKPEETKPGMSENNRQYQQNIQSEDKNVFENRNIKNTKEDIINEFKTSKDELRKVSIDQNGLAQEKEMPTKTSFLEKKQKEDGFRSVSHSDYDDFSPKNWSLSSNLSRKLDLFQTEDDQVIRMVDNKEKFEVSLDTSQYRPDELKVCVGEGVLSVEGKHEENSEDGRKMVSRQFSRKFNLPAGTEAESVISNLSSDGVLIITVRKQSLKTEKKENMELIDEDSRVPITMRHLFFDDPFFRSIWNDFDSIKENMFDETSRFWKGFNENTLQSEKSMFGNHQSLVDEMMGSCLHKESDLMMPRKWMMPSMLRSDFGRQANLFETKDSEVIRVKEDGDKFEMCLNTSQYRPDELNVTVDEGIISVEGKHEEKTEDGRKMVSRQFSRKYSLPAGARAENVFSNLSSDGVLTVSAPKEKDTSRGQRSVPIQSIYERC